MKRLLMIIMLGTSVFGAISEGENAAEFTLKTLDGAQKHSMDEFKGDVVLLNLWASWCDGCREEMPEFFKLQNEYKSGFKVVAVSIDKKEDASAKFIRGVEEELKMQNPMVMLYDPQKKLAKAYGAVAMPSSYLIDKNGVVRRVIVGSLHAEEIDALKREIDQLQ